MEKIKNVVMMCLIVAGTMTMNGQNVGISTTGIPPSGDAGLDVNFTDKGVLIPRVSLSNLTTYNPPITGGGPTTSLLIYNTNATIGVGYYYWDGSKWVKLITNGGSPSDAWLTTGNASTNPSTHFLGTTDNVDLVFQTNNTEKMRITSGGNVGIGTTTPSDKLQVDSSITLHSGGHKVVGFGWSPGVNQALMTGYPAEIRWEPTSGLLQLGIDNTSRSAGQTPNIPPILTLTQGRVGIGTASPNNSALLELNSTTSGFLVPRMTTAQRNAIVSPANSLIIFNTTTNCLEIYSSSTSNWQSIYCLCNTPSAPTANAAIGISQTDFTANWSSVAGATSYVLDVATDAAFTSFVPGYSNLNVGLVTNYNVTGLTCGTTYYYRVRAVGCAATSPNSNVITVTTSICCPTSYAVTTIPFSWSTISGTSAGVNCDDCVSGAIPIGFNFCFYGTTYTSVFFSSNGFLTFISGMGNGCCNGVTIPTAGGIEGFVAGCWTDLNPFAGGSVTYQTIGTAPNRIFVAQWQNVPEFGSGGNVSFQIKLYETSSRIEIHVSSIVIYGHTVTIGVENQTGTLGTAAPGYNAVSNPSISNIAWRFQ